MKKLFEDRGAKVHIQVDDSWELPDGSQIMARIDESDLIICLLGRKYGRALPANDRPKAARAHDSWTQWEYRYAREVIASDETRKKRLIPCIIRAPADSETSSLTRENKLQIGFIREICSLERATFHGKFFQYIENSDDIVASIQRMLNAENSITRQMRDAFWLEVKAKYRVR